MKATGRRHYLAILAGIAVSLPPAISAATPGAFEGMDGELRYDFIYQNFLAYTHPALEVSSRPLDSTVDLTLDLAPDEAPGSPEAPSSIGFDSPPPPEPLAVPETTATLLIGLAGLALLLRKRG